MNRLADFVEDIIPEKLNDASFFEKFCNMLVLQEI